MCLLLSTKVNSVTSIENMFTFLRVRKWFYFSVSGPVTTKLTTVISNEEFKTCHGFPI